MGEIVDITQILLQNKKLMQHGIVIKLVILRGNTLKTEETYGQEGEVVTQNGAEGCCRGDIDLGELVGRHLALSAFAEVDGAQRQRQSPQAAALRQVSYKDREKAEL